MRGRGRPPAHLLRGAIWECITEQSPERITATLVPGGVRPAGRPDLPVRASFLRVRDVTRRRTRGEQRSVVPSARAG
ncbi:hypothetical protein DAEQUDRAFT_723693 [Daedalea quercina L-15889]|uniref:Uncharacterized protein n=1 Tax=Daedalea quercina L-15889 TaxID=1314783 RepID=A0A165S7L1_9APHY|nr:hypothetical protein DAEQUDRAFT_723693 [Daedalea quercina L-15889]